MINAQMLRKLLETRISFQPSDPRIQETWQEMTEILSVDEKEAISFLNQCTEKEIFWLSEIFEDLSESFQSPQFIKSLKSLQQRHPNIDMSVDIKYAEMALRDK